MNEQTLRRFCESGHRPLIVIAGTFLAGLVLILPSVDVYYAGSNEKDTFEAELESARRITANKELEGQVRDRLAQLKSAQDRTVDDETMPALRERLLEIAKETGCNIRRLNAGASAARPWTAEGDPTVVHIDAKTKDGVTGTGFVLEWRPVNISLSGKNASLRAMLERIAAGNMFMHAKSIEMYPPSPNRQSLMLDLELWYFTLVRQNQG